MLNTVFENVANTKMKKTVFRRTIKDSDFVLKKLITYIKIEYCVDVKFQIKL